MGLMIRPMADSRNIAESGLPGLQADLAIAAISVGSSVTSPPNCRPARAIDLLFAYSNSLARSISRAMLRRVRRTAEVVNADYNLSHWHKVLSEKKWLNAENLLNFLIPGDSIQRLRNVDGKIVWIDGHSYYRYRVGALGNLIARHAGGVSHIAELGAGYGHNLFSLYLSHPDWTFEGYDIAPNGILAGTAIAQHFGLSDVVSMGRINVTDATDPNFASIAGKTVFTYFCIEQVPYDVAEVIENIIAARPRRVINIEPTTELLDLTKLRDLVSFAYIRTVDYQTALFTTLERLEREGRIRIFARERMRFAPTINHDGFFSIAGNPFSPTSPPANCRCRCRRPGSHIGLRARLGGLRFANPPNALLPPSSRPPSSPPSCPRAPAPGAPA